MIKTKIISMYWAVLGGFIGWFLGGLDDLLYALLTFVIADYTTGILCAISERKLSSEVGLRGVIGKSLFSF